MLVYYYTYMTIPLIYGSSVLVVLTKYKKREQGIRKRRILENNTISEAVGVRIQRVLQRFLPII